MENTAIEEDSRRREWSFVADAPRVPTEFSSADLT